ncbi:N-acetylglucosamine kinase [Aquimarina sp. MMG015]|uniref:N-acetylglucosamine kinase n=1 Tax=Aquimarina sp. MMG015 TaxID=2822689 RepID=UPI001B3A4025|nr:N-acetylglucosamine kinase [Aquimarina sp. MMG015]MBQ4801849.1 N-acetylglucosamine kinase [Aquimarina sp. MMG015]
MILIADSGSTKCDWILMDSQGKQVFSQTTIGINPLNTSQNKIESILLEISEVSKKRNLINEVHFYGAGCNTEASNQKVKSSFQSIFKNLTVIKIEEDIIAAVHATTKTPAVIVILGTGSNCCYFDGKKIIQYAPSLGYLLADEGSGNYFGKELLKSFYLQKMPSSLAKEFETKFGSNLEQLFYNLYDLRQPNAYLASYAFFMFQHRNHPFIERMLYYGIKVFIDNYLTLYSKELENNPIHFVGSIAYYSQDIINKILLEKGFTAKSFIKKPINNLINHIISTRNTLQKTI